MAGKQDTEAIWWDWTAPCEIDHENLEEIAIHTQYMKEELDDIADLWCYQLEEGEETGYLHFQGRMQLKKRMRRTALSKIFGKKFHWDKTSGNCSRSKKPFAYVQKEDTRVLGPWKSAKLNKKEVSEDPNAAIPREDWPFQVADIEKYYPWQQRIMDSAKPENRDKRTINILIDTEGAKGKSSLKTIMTLMALAEPLPYMNNYKDIMRMIMCAPRRPCYIVDLPRALRKNEMYNFISGIESVKDGYCCDDRYTWKRAIIASPCIWIFSNVVPDIKMLSRDRWKIWEIEDKEDPMECDLEAVPIGSKRFKELVNKSNQENEFNIEAAERKYRSIAAAAVALEMRKNRKITKKESSTSSDSESNNESPPKKIGKIAKKIVKTTEIIGESEKIRTPRTKESSSEDENDVRYIYPNVS